MASLSGTQARTSLNTFDLLGAHEVNAKVQDYIITVFSSLFFYSYECLSDILIQRVLM